MSASNNTVEVTMSGLTNSLSSGSQSRDAADNTVEVTMSGLTNSLSSGSQSGDAADNTEVQMYELPPEIHDDAQADPEDDSDEESEYDSEDDSEDGNPRVMLPHGEGVTIGGLGLPKSSRLSLDKQYFVVKQLADLGANGTVMLAINRPSPDSTSTVLNGKLFAVKIPLSGLIRRRMFTQERDVLQTITSSYGPRKEHIISLVRSDPSPHIAWFAVPFIEGPTLIKMMDLFEQRKKSVPWWFVFHFLIEALYTLSWLHEKSSGKPESIAHLDVHAGNFILDYSRIPKDGPSNNATMPELLRYMPRCMLLDFGRARTDAMDGRNRAKRYGKVDIYHLIRLVYGMMRINRVNETNADVAWLQHIRNLSTPFGYGITSSEMRMVHNTHARRRLRVNLSVNDVLTVKETALDAAYPPPDHGDIRYLYNHAYPDGLMTRVE